MKPLHVVGTFGLVLAVAACEQRPLAGPEVAPIRLGAAPPGQAAPLIFVDGQLVASADLRRLRPADIQTVEVIKGQAALRLYGDEGRHGVILIHTK